MNPYERTANEMKRQSEGPKRYAKSAIGAGLAAGAASFAPLLSRAAPFLSQYIPENLAVKGLSKISPKLGSFVQQAMKGGYDFNEVKDFIGEQVNESKDGVITDDIIEKYSPELSSFIESLMDKGETPETAAAVVRNVPKNFTKFKDAIEKIEKHTGQDFFTIVNKIYAKLMKGKDQKQSQQIPQDQAMQQQQPSENPGQLQQQPPPQQGQINPQIQAALQKIMQL